MLERVKKKKNIQYFWVFVLGSMFGVIYEESLHMIKYFFRHGSLNWARRRGLLYGPFNPVYGVGALLMTIFLADKKDKWYVTFLKAAFLGGSTEFIASFLQEKICGNVSWDYSNHFLNFNGRTSVPVMIAWGILGIFFLKVVYPVLNKIVENTMKHVKLSITILMMIFMSFDIFFTGIVVLRQSLRHNGVKQYTVIDQLLDTYFDDDYIKKKYPNSFVKRER